MQLSSHFTCGNRSDENKIKDFHLGILLLAIVTTNILSVDFFYSKLHKSLHVILPCLQIIPEEKKKKKKHSTTTKSCEVVLFGFQQCTLLFNYVA